MCRVRIDEHGKGFAPGRVPLVGAFFRDPAFKQRDPLGGPCPVARHRPFTEASVNRAGMGAHIGCRPEVEGEAHRFSIAGTEQAVPTRNSVLFVAIELTGVCW